MSKEQEDLILKMLPVNLEVHDIFLALDKPYNILEQKKDMEKDLDIRYIDVKIKLAVIYNEFQNRYPDLYGDLNRDNKFAPKTYSIFEMYTNDKGEEVISGSFSITYLVIKKMKILKL
jgi:hypothetical protein